MFPADDASLRDAGGEHVAIHGPVHIVLHVLLARPHHFDRTVHLLGNLHRGVDHVDFEPAAEPPSDEMIVYGDLLEGQSGPLRSDGLGSGEHLDAHPDLAGGGGHVHGTVQRFHGGVGEKGQFVGRLEQLSFRQSLGDVARGLGNRAFSLACSTDLFPYIVGGNAGVRPLVPPDIERAQTLFGRPHVITHDGDRLLEHDHLPDTGQLSGARVIDVAHGAAEHRADGKRCELEAGRHGIDSIDRPAVDLVRRVEPLERMPDQFEIIDVLERRILRRREAARPIDERRIREPAAARLVDGLAFLGAYAGRLDLPLLRSGLNQHDARARRSLAQGQPERAHRIGVAGDL